MWHPQTLYYEELGQEQEQLRAMWECLTTDESKSSTKESSLDLGQKDQASLSQASTLEGWVQSLEQDLQDARIQVSVGPPPSPPPLPLPLQHCPQSPSCLFLPDRE